MVSDLTQVLLGIDDDGDGVERHGQLDEGDAGLAAHLHFLCEDGPRGIGNIDVAAAQLLEAAASAGQPDGHANRAALLGLKFLSDRFGDRKDGARTVDADHSRIATGRRGRFRALFLAAARQHCRQWDHQRDCRQTPCLHGNLGTVCQWRKFAGIHRQSLASSPLLTVLPQRLLVQLRKLIGDLKPIRLELYEDMFVRSQLRVIVEQARGDFEPVRIDFWIGHA